MPAPRIACLGWGSLTWDPRSLRVDLLNKPWHPDGPALPIEFARQSRDGRITLVIISEGTAVSTLWAEMDVACLDEARSNLLDREWPGGNSRDVVGFWSPVRHDNALYADIIGDWARERGLAGVVWTKLPAQFHRKIRVPSESEVVDYLRGLRGDAAQRAEEYVRRTPRQIATPYRRAIETALHWLYDGSLTDANIRSR